ncbi:MAG: hypothetical protein RJA16_1793, partial [Planctomycetota bacterium]
VTFRRNLSVGAGLEVRRSDVVPPRCAPIRPAEPPHAPIPPDPPRARPPADRHLGLRLRTELLALRRVRRVRGAGLGTQWPRGHPQRLSRPGRRGRRRSGALHRRIEPEVARSQLAEHKQRRSGADPGHRRPAQLRPHPRLHRGGVGEARSTLRHERRRAASASLPEEGDRRRRHHRLRDSRAARRQLARHRVRQDQRLHRPRTADRLRRRQRAVERDEPSRDRRSRLALRERRLRRLRPHHPLRPRRRLRDDRVRPRVAHREPDRSCSAPDGTPRAPSASSCADRSTRFG